MSEQERLNDEDDAGLDEAGRAMEKSLRGLIPSRPAIDVTSVLREAIARSEAALRASRRQAWIWRGVAAVLVASVMLMDWIVRTLPPSRIVVERPVHETMTDEAPSISRTTDASSPPGACTYLVLRQQVLAHGLDALHDAPDPAPKAPEESPMRVLRLYRGGK